MKIIRFHHVIMIVALLVVVLLNMMIESVWTRRNFEFLPDMVFAVPAEAQSESWYMAMRSRDLNPVPGTLIRTSDHRPAFFPSEVIASTDSSAQAWMAASIPRGREVYAVFCSPCHGMAGAGDGEIAKRGYPPPPSLLAENSIGMSDSEMYRIISEGKGNMPGHASQIPISDIWKSILFIRVMQKDVQRVGGS